MRDAVESVHRVARALARLVRRQADPVLRPDRLGVRIVTDSRGGARALASCSSSRATPAWTPAMVRRAPRRLAPAMPGAGGGACSSADETVVVRLRHVSRVFGRARHERRALDRVDLDVARGEFLTVVGPGGSGKSTMLQLIAGLDRPTAGEIWVVDHALPTMTDDELSTLRRRQIGMIFQSFNLLPALTAEQNIALPLLLDGRPRPEVLSRVERVIELVGLAGRRRHRPGEMSGEERQRVAIARALVIEPLLLLADEPTGSLDCRTGEIILEVIREASERAGQTVILVTHEARVAAFGSRRVTLRDGRVEGDARVARGSARPGGQRGGSSSQL